MYTYSLAGGATAGFLQCISSGLLPVYIILNRTATLHPVTDCVTEAIFNVNSPAVCNKYTATLLFSNRLLQLCSMYRRKKEMYVFSSGCEHLFSSLDCNTVHVYSPTEGKIQDCSSADSVTVELARVGTPRGLQFGFPYSPSNTTNWSVQKMLIKE